MAGVLSILVLQPVHSQAHARVVGTVRVCADQRLCLGSRRIRHRHVLRGAVQIVGEAGLVGKPRVVCRRRWGRQ